MSTLKDRVTNYIALITVILGSVNAYLQTNSGGEIDWFQLNISVALAIGLYLTGKSGDGTPKITE